MDSWLVGIPPAQNYNERADPKRTGRVNIFFTVVNGSNCQWNREIRDSWKPYLMDQKKGVRAMFVSCGCVGARFWRCNVENKQSSPFSFSARFVLTFQASRHSRIILPFVLPKKDNEQRTWRAL
jgi:hypothetical protein